jgi:hypothetical protein
LKVTTQVCDEESDSSSDYDEYEEEFLEEFSIYYSEQSEPEKDAPEYYDLFDFSEYSDKEEGDEELEEELVNPAAYLTEINLAETKELENSNTGPMEYYQQQLFQNLLDEYNDICAKSQVEIG